MIEALMEKLITLPSQLYAPTVTLLVFFLGLFFRGVYKLWAKAAERRRVRILVRKVAEDLSHELIKQSKNFKHSSEQFQFKEKPNFVLQISEIYAYDLFGEIGSLIIHDSFGRRVSFLSFIDKITFSRYLELRVKALHRLLRIASTNKIWHNKAKDDLDRFIADWKLLEIEWYTNLEKVILRTERWFLNSNSSSSQDFQEFLTLLDRIIVNWRCQKNCTLYPVVYTSLIQSAMSLARDERHIKLEGVYEFVNDLRNVERLYNSMSNLLSVYRSLYHVAYANAKNDSLILKKIVKLI